MSDRLSPELAIELILNAAERFGEITVFDSTRMYKGRVKSVAADGGFLYLENVSISENRRTTEADEVTLRIDTVTAVIPIVIKRKKPPADDGPSA